MPAETLFAELSSMSYADRIPVCREVLGDQLLDDNTRSRVMYFLAHALKQANCQEEAYDVCQDLLAMPMPDGRLISVLVLCALCQYELGLFVPLAETLDKLQQYPMLPPVEGHWLVLRGRMLIRNRDPQAFSLLEKAEFLPYGSKDYEQLTAWAQLSTARMAYVLGDLERALSAVNRVSFRPYIPKARLMEAEIRLQQGNFHDALDLAVQVNAGAYGEYDAVDKGRSLCIRSACAVAQGDFWNGALLYEEARQLAHAGPFRDLELIDMVNALRAKFAS